MNSEEAREYVRLATTETKGRTKIACDLLIDESVKLEKIEQVIKEWNCDILECQRDLWMYLADIKEILEKE